MGQCRLSRRQVLRLVALALPAAAVGFKRSDVFDRERVCVHVYDPARPLPAPLLRPAGTAAARPADSALFHVGLPELILCRCNTRLLLLYPYFWPVGRRQVRQLQGAVQVLHHSPAVAGQRDIREMCEKMLALRRAGEDQNGSLAVIFTLNDATRNVIGAVADACRSMQVSELVIFKDPSRPPYLCSYASRQKGFKRPPPIG